jgi:hypothetical protein
MTQVEFSFKAIQLVFTVTLAVLFLIWLKIILDKKRTGSRSRRDYQTHGNTPRAIGLKCALMIILTLWFFHLEQDVNELLYDLLFDHYSANQEARDLITLVRKLERRILWALTEFLTALSIMYLIYIIGLRVKI